MNAPYSTIVQCLWNNCIFLRDEQHLSVVKEVESAVEAGLARAARLRQAILKAAFEGRL